MPVSLNPWTALCELHTVLNITLCHRVSELIANSALSLPFSKTQSLSVIDFPISSIAEHTVAVSLLVVYCEQQLSHHCYCASCAFLYPYAFPFPILSFFLLPFLNHFLSFSHLPLLLFRFVTFHFPFIFSFSYFFYWAFSPFSYFPSNCICHNPLKAGRGGGWRAIYLQNIKLHTVHLTWT